MTFEEFVKRVKETHDPGMVYQATKVETDGDSIVVTTLHCDDGDLKIYRIPSLEALTKRWKTTKKAVVDTALMNLTYSMSLLNLSTKVVVLFGDKAQLKTTTPTKVAVGVFLCLLAVVRYHI